MFLSSIKSKTQKFYSVVQPINLIKRAFTSGIFKSVNATLKVQVARPSLQMFRFEKNSSVRVYHPLFIMLLASLFLVSCQKEELNNPVLNSTSSDDLSASANKNNTPPNVDAGPLRRIVYSSSSRATTLSTTLYGRASDAEGAVSVLWTQTLGNSTAVIAHPNKDTTDVSNLKPGSYTFVFSVTDSKGAVRKDSTFVTVLQKMTWTIEGVTREALVHPPTGAKAASPIIFAFHGHGGSDLGWSERAFEVNWPEAIVVYPQGLPTKSPSDKTGKSSGWQLSVGEVNGATGIKDQDLKFFDGMVSTLKNKYNVNSKFIFAHGWSNGGEFVYNVLWAARGSQLAAISPASATLESTNGKNPLPMIHVAGTSDNHVSFNNQQKSVQAVRSLDKCTSSGSTWATGKGGILGTQYASSTNDPVVMLQYDGGHNYPFTVPPFIVQFFKQVAGVK